MAKRFDLLNDIVDVKRTLGDHFVGSAEDLWNKANARKPNTEGEFERAIKEITACLPPHNVEAKQKKYMQMTPKPRDITV